MNKKISIIIGVVVVLALAAYFTFSKKETPKQTENNNQVKTEVEVASEQSLKDLLMEGKPLKCEFKDEQSIGTFYLADQKMRSDVQITSEGKAMVNHTIMIDKTSYVWVEGEKSGFKMTIKEEEIKDTSAPAPTEKQESVSLDKKMDYKCSAWSKDASYFELPAGVQFNDLSSMMPAGTPIIPADKETKESTGDNSLKNSQCAACDSVPAESRAQCKTALGCN